jgi:predicted NAD/FAD-binding protein
VTLFERDQCAGGHAHSVEVAEDDRVLGLETAFAVYNEPHYPKLTKFFAELGVASLAHSGGFSFFDKAEGWRYTSEDLEAPAGASPMDAHPKLAKIRAEADRFYAETPKHFIRGRCDLPLGDYLAREGYSDEFKWGFIVLICSAAWSVPAEKVWEMAAAVVVAFFWGHGRAGLGGRSVEWRTVEGGSISYVRRVVAALRDYGNEVCLGTAAQCVRETTDGVEVISARGVERFDRAVIATHLDDSMGIVDNLEEQRRSILSVVQYNPTKVCLHTDPSVMPDCRGDWRSWNYGRRTAGGEIKSWVVYYLNRLQGIDARQDYFTTLDYPGDIADGHLIAELNYRHPVLSQTVRSMQDELYAASLTGAVKFCGGYLASRKVGKDMIGNHESAFDAGLAVAETLMRELDIGSGPT